MTGVGPLSALEYGVLAEKSGFDTLWLPDHFVDQSAPNGDRVEPWSVLTAVALKTKKIRLASGVTDTQRTHPTRTAQAVACLDEVSHGRAVLGIGAGEAMNIVPFGLPWEKPHERLARLAEAIQVVRALWSSSPENAATFSGQYYRLENAFLSQSPRQKPHPPIYVGAHGSRSGLQVAGQLGDGWYAWYNTPDTFRKRWAIIKEAAESAGRAPEQIRSNSHIGVAFPRNTREEKTALLACKGTLLLERSLLSSTGYETDIQLSHYQNLLLSNGILGINRGLAARHITEAAARIPDDLVYRVMAIGGAEEVQEKIEELATAGVKEFAVVDLLKQKKRTLRLFRRIIRSYR